MKQARKLSSFARNLLALGALALTMAISAVLASAQPADPKAPVPAPAPGMAAPVARFEAVDLYVDAGARPLAAWQVHLSAQAPGGDVKIVGIEGGASKAYANPPYYDPAAMTQNRVILAGLSVAPAAELPTGRTRIARVHVQIAGTRAPAEYSLNLIAAADPQAEAIAPKVSVEQTPAGKPGAPENRP